ncbi:hypothetical protein EQVG_00102 [Emiliania huxleyi virus 207]|nr:hypothetical protein EQVG_00102 [Emiliania huxleyi virus 207]AEP15934.1 hypothetical protein ERVG_00056 [Emiliania huxleyi virus 208]
MDLDQKVLIASIVICIYICLHARLVAIKHTPDGGADFRIPLDIFMTYAAGALTYVAIFNGAIGVEQVIRHPLMGITFFMPLFIFINEIKRDRDWVDEVKVKDGYGIFRVNVLVSVAMAAAGMMSKNTKVRVTSLAMGMGAVVMPMTTSLPGSSQGAVMDAAQRVGIITTTWAVVGVVAKELFEQEQLKW